MADNISTGILSGLYEKVYNPDVLSCLANLSNDEVFTPPEIVNKMLDMLPQELPQAVKDFIGRKYPGARIVDAEREKGGLEVEIIDGRTPREVYFGAGDAWLRTKTEVRRSEVPAAVMQAFQTSQYAGWEIDDIDHYDSPERQWYLFELEDPQSDREAELRIQADGTIF